MQFAFDLISDLHAETWGEFDWTGKATSTVCVVAGDLARDRDVVCKALRNLGKCYQAVFYIDGNDEHTDHIENLSSSYTSLARRIQRIPNVVYLQDNVIVIEGIAILGTNGWFGFDFDPDIDPEQASMWAKEKYNISDAAINSIAKMSDNDAGYMISSVKRLQKHNDVKKIVMVTHTVPNPVLIRHDIDLDGSMRFNTMGNRFMMQTLSVDTEKKIHTWCFGHYHGSIDQTHDGVRFVNNCRGRGDTKYSNYAYHPLRVVIDY